jgi:hypothetical protein
MDLRTLMVGAALAAGLAGLAENGRADIVAGENVISVASGDVATPSRGMTMNQVSGKFGAPTTKVPAVGNPPISRWEYPGFVVYFERDHVIHSVVSGSAAPISEPPPPPPAEAPPASLPPPPPPAAMPAPTAEPAPAPAAPAAPATEDPQP